MHASFRMGFAAFALFVCGLALPPQILATQSIVSATASPNGVAINTPTTVLIAVAVVSDSFLIRNGVTLVRYDQSGRALSSVFLYDDGTHGDAVAGDNIFSTQLSVAESTPTTLYYKASVAYRTRLTRLLSTSINIDVVRVPSPSEVTDILATNQRARNSSGGSGTR